MGAADYFKVPKTPVDKGVSNAQRHVEFKVLVYRMELPGNPTIGQYNDKADAVYADAEKSLLAKLESVVNSDAGVSEADLKFIRDNKATLEQQRAEATRKVADIKINHILNLEFSSALYGEIIKNINTSAFTVARFLSNFNAAMAEQIDDDMVGSFKVLDITPLVLNVDTTNSLDGANGCNISTLDPTLTDFSQQTTGERWRGTYYAQIRPQLSTNAPQSILLGRDGKTPIVGQKLPAAELKSFTFREFDLVRVFVYSSEMSPTEMMKRVAEPKYSDGVDGDMVFLPTFTGLVHSITKSSAAGSLPTIQASCIGMMKVFMNSVCVMDQALANVVSQAEPGIADSASIINIQSTLFHGKTTVEAFKYLVDIYLHPTIIRSGKEEIIGIPDMDRFSGSDTVGGLDDLTILYTQEKVKPAGSEYSESKPTTSITPALVQFLPTLMLYHKLKSMYREPISVYDDRLSRVAKDVSKSIAGMSLTDSKDNSYLIDLLKPYLEMLKDNFDLWDANYTSAASIFDIIRNETYLEVFEDRTGAFHLRFPRYNMATAKDLSGKWDTIAVSFTKDDSGVFNAVTSKLVSGYIGNLEHPGSVYLDRVSIARYGMRAPQVTTNPNCRSIKFIQKFAEFVRDYTAGKEARKATIVRLIDTSVNVGDMVFFTIRTGVPSVSGPVPNAAAIETYYVGYVTQVEESLSVSEASRQTLNLEFVREVSGGDIRLADIACTESRTAWGAVSAAMNLAGSVNTTGIGPGKEELRRKMTIPMAVYLNAANKILYSKPSLNVGSWLTPVTSPSENRVMISFKHIPSAEELAALALEAGVVEDSKTAGSISSGANKTETPDQIAQRVAALRSKISKQKIVLGKYWVLKKILERCQEWLTQKSAAVIGAQWEEIDWQTQAATGGGAVARTAKLGPSTNLKDVGAKFRTAFEKIINSTMGGAGSTPTGVVGCGELATNLQASPEFASDVTFIPPRLSEYQGPNLPCTYEQIIWQISNSAGGKLYDDWMNLFGKDAPESADSIQVRNANLLIATMVDAIYLAIKKIDENVKNDSAYQRDHDELQSAIEKGAKVGGGSFIDMITKPNNVVGSSEKGKSSKTTAGKAS